MKSGRVVIVTALLSVGAALWYPAVRSQQVAAQGRQLTGSYGFSASTIYTGANDSISLAVVGMLSFDGVGNATGSETIVQPDTSPSATTVQSAVVPLTGTYTLNADSTGTMTLLPGIPNATPATISFVLTDGGAGYTFVVSSGTPFLLTGTGRRQ